MGFIDALYILNDSQSPIFNYFINPKTPSFSYIRNQLLIAKREMVSKSGIPDSISNFDSSYDGIFDSIKLQSYSSYSKNNTDDLDSESISNVISLDPVLKLDSDWMLSWVKADNLYLVCVGTCSPTYLDVVSDDEEDEDDDSEEEEGEEDSEGQEIHTSSNKRINDYTELIDNETDSKTSQSSTNGELLNKSNLNPIIDNEPSGNSTVIEQMVSNIPNPLQYIEFLNTFFEAIKMMLQTTKITPHKIQLNSHRIIMLLQELLDASVPFVVDMNQLRELLPNNSIIDKLVSATKQIHTAAHSISNIKNTSIKNIKNDLIPSFDNNSNNFKYPIVLERSNNPIPWRAINPKNLQNEIFVDLYEAIELIVEPKSKSSKKLYSSFNNLQSHNSYSKIIINGHMDLFTSLADSPILEIQLSSPLFSSYESPITLDDCYSTLHKSINKDVWSNSNTKTLELIPPDEKCKILTYTIDLIELQNEISENLDINKFTGAIGVELHSGLGINRNEFEIIVNTGYGLNNGFGNNNSNESGNIKEIENLSIEIFFPDSALLEVDDTNDMTNNNNSNSNNNSNNNIFKNEGSLNNSVNEYGANDGFNASKTDNSRNGKEKVEDSFDMRVIRSSTGTISKTNKGNYEWKLDNTIVIGGIYTLRGCIGFGSENSREYHDEVKEDKNKRRDKSRKKKVELSPRFLRVNYKHHGSVPSGIKVQNIKVLNNNSDGTANNKIKPFKGVKYTTITGDYVVR